MGGGRVSEQGSRIGGVVGAWCTGVCLVTLARRCLQHSPAAGCLPASKLSLTMPGTTSRVRSTTESSAAAAREGGSAVSARSPCLHPAEPGAGCATHAPPTHPPTRCPQPLGRAIHPLPAGSAPTGVHVQGTHARHLLNHAQAHEALHARGAHGAVVAAAGRGGQSVALYTTNTSHYNVRCRKKGHATVRWRGLHRNSCGAATVSRRSQ